MKRVFTTKAEKSPIQDLERPVESKVKSNPMGGRLLGGLAVLAAVGAMGLNSSKQASAESPSLAEAQPPAAQIDTAGKDKGYSFKRLSGDRGGSWSFFGDPRSIQVKEDIYTGWIAKNGFVQISQYDTETHSKKTVTLGPNLGRFDDHNNPSLMARKDGRIMAFYSPHSGRALPLNAVSNMYYRTTKKPGDITEWGGIRKVPTNTGNNKLGYTYPNPVPIGDGKTFLGWRGGNWQPTASITPDHGKSWTKSRTTVKSPGIKRPYVKYSEGPKNSVNMTYNQDNPGTTSTGLYFMQYRPGHGYYKANGEKIANSKSTIPFSRGDMIMSKNRHGRLYTMDTATDKKGNPVAVFTGKRKGEDASMFYSRWDGKHWKTEHIADTGYELYDNTKPRNYGFYPTAGMSLDHEDPTNVYLSRQVNKQMRVEKWEHEAPGKWSHEAVSPPEKSCVRPASVRNHTLGNAAVVMMCGKYTDWLHSDTSIYIAEPKQAKAKD